MNAINTVIFVLCNLVIDALNTLWVRNENGSWREAKTIGHSSRSGATCWISQAEVGYMVGWRIDSFIHHVVGAAKEELASICQRVQLVVSWKGTVLLEVTEGIAGYVRDTFEMWADFFEGRKFERPDKNLLNAAVNILGSAIVAECKRLARKQAMNGLECGKVVRLEGGYVRNRLPLVAYDNGLFTTHATQLPSLKWGVLGNIQNSDVILQLANDEIAKMLSDATGRSCYLKDGSWYDPSIGHTTVRSASIAVTDIW